MCSFYVADKANATILRSYFLWHVICEAIGTFASPTTPHHFADAFVHSAALAQTPPTKLQLCKHYAACNRIRLPSPYITNRVIYVLWNVKIVKNICRENRSYLDVQIVGCCAATSKNERSKWIKKRRKKAVGFWGAFVHCRTRKCSIGHICVLLYGMGGGDSASRCGRVPQCGHKRCCLPTSRHTIFVSLFLHRFRCSFYALAQFVSESTRFCRDEGNEGNEGNEGKGVYVWCSSLFFFLLVFLLYIFLFRQKLILCRHKCILHLDFCRRGDGKNGGGQATAEHCCCWWYLS